LVLFAALGPGCQSGTADDDGSQHPVDDDDDDTQDPGDDDWEWPAETPDPLDPMVIDDTTSSDGFQGIRYTWADRSGAQRDALMVDNDIEDPVGHWGGYLREFSYVLDTGATRTCVGSSSNHPGWGYTVNHYGSTSVSSRRYPGTWEVVFEGRHHAVHRYDWTTPIDGHDVDVTVQWLFTSGRDHPVWAITYDASNAPADAIDADSRAPYGDLQWDGGAGVEVEGIGWGDHYRFRSLDSPITLYSGWDYSLPNQIPHVIEWSAAADAEMGCVQTQTMDQRDAGGYWFYTAWGDQDLDGPMPDDWNWTYQLNQYELPWGSTSKRLAWGTNFGAVGQQQYSAYGDSTTLIGYPYQSYAVHVVLGQHSLAPVEQQIEQVEIVQGVVLSATTGTVVTHGPAGVGRSDEMTYEPAGYNPATATFELRAEQDQARWTLDAGDGVWTNPVFVIHGYELSEAPQYVIVDGYRLTADAHYLASVDADRHQLWLTLRAEISGSSSMEIY